MSAKSLHPKTPLENIELGLRILAILIAGVWAWYVFQYQNYTLPSKEQSECTIKMNLRYLKTDSNLRFYMLTVHLKNEGKISEQIVSCVFNISGSTLAPKNQYLPIIDAHQELQWEYENRYYYQTHYEYFAGGRVFAERTTIQPNKEIVSDRLIALPINKYSPISIEVFTIQSKPDMKLYPLWRQDNGGKLYTDIQYQSKDSTYILKDYNLSADDPVLAYRDILMYMPQSLDDSVRK